MSILKMSTVERAQNSNNIVDIVGSVVKLQRAGPNYIGICPFHEDNTGAFCVNTARQVYHCFGCGKSGNVISFIMDYKNYSFSEAVQHLVENAGMNLSQIESGRSEDGNNL